MEKTKIFVIERSSGGFLTSSSKVMGFCFSREEAEFKTWDLNKKSNEQPTYPYLYSYGGSYYRWYSIDFIDVKKDDKSKEYQKFLKEKISEIQEKIEKSKTCKNEDEKNISELEKDLNYYNLQSGNPVLTK